MNMGGEHDSDSEAGENFDDDMMRRNDCYTKEANET